MSAHAHNRDLLLPRLLSGQIPVDPKEAIK